MSFEDDSFPPIAKSLTFDGNEVLNVKMWLRPSEISLVTRNKIKWAVFRNPRPSDIIQGTIGNCWYKNSQFTVFQYLFKFILFLVLHTYWGLAKQLEFFISTIYVT